MELYTGQTELIHEMLMNTKAREHWIKQELVFF